ncbi:MAG: RDD family protein [Nitriliruptoraceae bacterium]
MATSAAVLVLLLAAAHEGRGSRRRFGSLTGTVSNRVIEEVDVDAIVRRVDIEALVARVDVDALLARVDVDALLERVAVDDLLDRVDVDRLLDRVDPNRLLDRVDVDRLLDRVDPNRLLDRVEVDRLLDRVDVDRLLDRVDVDRVLDRADLERLLARVDLDELLARVDLDTLLATVDVEALVRRAGIPELIADSTGQAANSALDLARRQLVALDVAALHLAQRLLRRDPAALPPGPPLLLADRAGVVQEPRLSRSRTKARIEVSGYYAGPLSRLLAFAGDTVAATGTFTAAAGATSWLLAVTIGSGFDTVQRAGLLWAGALAVWNLLWWWGTVAVTGRTPVMAVVGLKVVNRSGAPVGSLRALLRVLLLPVSLALLGLGFAIMLVDPERRALHDRIAGSSVVYDWGGRPAELPTPLSRWLERQGGAGSGPPEPGGPVAPEGPAQAGGPTTTTGPVAPEGPTSPPAARV